MEQRIRRSCSIWLAMGLLSLPNAACDSRPVGRTSDGGVHDGAVLDGAVGDAGTYSCVPDLNRLGCVEIVFPEQQTAFTQAEAAAGIGFQWELVVPDPLAEVYPSRQDPGCCVEGVGPLRAREQVFGNDQMYCECDFGLCDPAPCENPPAVSIEAGQSSHIFWWPGVNWYGPSDTGTPYGLPFPRGEYIVQVHSMGEWRPPGSASLQSYLVSGQLAIEIVDGCGDRPAVEAALWDCSGGVGEGGLCVEIVVDAAGEPVSWVPDILLEPAVEACLDAAIMGDCYPSLAGTTEQVCIYGV